MTDPAELIVVEMRAVDDWVSVAAALGVMGISSFTAGRDDVRYVLDCVDTSDRLRLGRVGDRFEEISKPLPIAELLETIFREDDAGDRTAAMMGLFIDTILSPDEQAKEAAAPQGHTHHGRVLLPPGWAVLDDSSPSGIDSPTGSVFGPVGVSRRDRRSSNPRRRSHSISLSLPTGWVCGVAVSMR